MGLGRFQRTAYVEELPRPAVVLGDEVSGPAASGGLVDMTWANKSLNAAIKMMLRHGRCHIISRMCEYVMPMQPAAMTMLQHGA